MFDGVPDQSSSFTGIKLRRFFKVGNLVGQAAVLNNVAKPAAVIAML
jgi:hypothetical protein